jgi:1,4-dihydroxy-2-naphthoate octaprenyltransferase
MPEREGSDPPGLGLLLENYSGGTRARRLCVADTSWHVGCLAAGVTDREEVQRLRAEGLGASEAFRTVLVHLRLHYQLLFLSPLFLFGFLLGGAQPSVRALVGFVSFHVFLYGGVTAYNSFYDRDEGPVGGLRAPPPVVPELLPASLAIKLVGFGLAVWVGFGFASLYALVVALSIAYSHPRFRWKARPLLSLVVVAFGQGAVGFFSGYLCAREPAPLLFAWQPLLGAAVASATTVSLYPLTQLYQIQEDRARGDRTFAVVFGPDACFRFAAFGTVVAAACAVPLLFLRFGPGDAAAMFAAFVVLFFVIRRWQQRFEADVFRNFAAVHRLQHALSFGIVAYIAVRIALGG